MPTKWLQERANCSKNEPLIPPRRASCGTRSFRSGSGHVLYSGMFGVDVALLAYSKRPTTCHKGANESIGAHREFVYYKTSLIAELDLDRAGGSADRGEVCEVHRQPRNLSAPRGRCKSPFSGPTFARAVAGIRRLVVHIKAHKKTSWFRSKGRQLPAPPRKLLSSVRRKRSVLLDTTV